MVMLISFCCADFDGYTFYFMRYVEDSLIGDGLSDEDRHSSSSFVYS